MKYEIQLTDVQNLALSFVAVSPHEWITNAAEARSIAAIDEIIQIALSKSLEQGVSLPGTKEEIVSMAFDRGWVETAEQRQNNILQQMRENTLSA